MDDVEIIVSVSTNKVGSKCEETIAFDREDWESMSEQEQEEVCRDEIFQMIEWNYEISGS